MLELQRIAKDLQTDSRTIKAATVELWKKLGYSIYYHHDTQSGDEPYIKLKDKLFDAWYESPDCAALFAIDVFVRLDYKMWLTETIRYKENKATAMLSVCFANQRPNRLYTVTEEDESNIAKARFFALMKVLGKALYDVPYLPDLTR